MKWKKPYKHYEIDNKINR